MGEFVTNDSRYLYYISLLNMIYYCAHGGSITVSPIMERSSSISNDSATTTSLAITSVSSPVWRTDVVSTINSIKDDKETIIRIVENKTFNFHDNISTETLAGFNQEKPSKMNKPPSSINSTKLVAKTQRTILKKHDVAAVPDHDVDDDLSYVDDKYEEYEDIVRNKSVKGKYVGAPCNEKRCDPTLLKVICDDASLQCVCERNYPVNIGLTRGCAKPKKLGEQCFYDETCIYNDENSLCVQVRHNALCQCTSGYHSVSYMKPTKRVFCTQDLKELTSDLPTLLGVSTGIAVLAGLICLVLHLFSKTKYPRHRHFGDANLPPPVMYSSDSGILHEFNSGRRSSRSSLRSSTSMDSYGKRRSSSGGGGGGGGAGHSASSGSKGILVSTSRTGSRRPSIASIHSTSSSVRSYSMMRFEKEQQQKEIRQEMKLRLTRLQQQHSYQTTNPQIMIGDTLLLHNSAYSGLIGLPGGNSDSLPTLKETRELSSETETVSQKAINIEKHHSLEKLNEYDEEASNWTAHNRQQ